MKKFLSIFVMMILALSFVACKKNNEDTKQDAEPTKATDVVEIDEQNSTVTDLKFVAPNELVPENPVPTEGPVEVDFVVNVNINATPTDDDEATPVVINGQLGVNFRANSLTFDKLEQLECAAEINVKLEGGFFGDEPQEVALDLYLKSNVVYASIPAKLLGTDAEGDMVVSVDLTKLVEALSSLIAAEAEGASEEEIKLPDLSQYKDLDNYTVENLLNTLVEAYPELKEAGFDEAFIKVVAEFINNLLPKLDYENKTFKLVINDATIDETLDKITAFLKANLTKINEIASHFVQEGFDPLTNEQIDEIKPGVKEALKELTINDIHANFGLNDKNRVNKIDAKADFVVDQVSDTCEWDEEQGEVCTEVSRTPSHWLVDLSLELDTNKVDFSLNASEDTTVDGETTRNGALELTANFAKSENGATAKATLVVYDEEDKLFDAKANANWETLENGLKAGLEVNVESDETLVKVGVDCELTAKNLAAIEFTFDTTTAIDMTESVLGMIGSSFGGTTPNVLK